MYQKFCDQPAASTRRSGRAGSSRSATGSSRASVLIKHTPVAGWRRGSRSRRREALRRRASGRDPRRHRLDQHPDPPVPASEQRREALDVLDRAVEPRPRVWAAGRRACGRGCPRVGLLGDVVSTVHDSIFVRPAPSIAPKDRPAPSAPVGAMDVERLLRRARALPPSPSTRRTPSAGIRQRRRRSFRGTRGSSRRSPRALISRRGPGPSRTTARGPSAAGRSGRRRRDACAPPARPARADVVARLELERAARRRRRRR